MSTPRRSFGVNESALDDNDTPNDQPTARRLFGRLSFNRSQHRSSWRAVPDEEGGEGPADERPPIPSALQTPGEAYTTPLPALSMVVLSITMLGEFLSANVSTPFLLFMVKGFGEITDKAEIAFWTGTLVSTFFLTQFLTSLLWATVADKHGQRFVLSISLFGSAITCLAFGTSTSLEQAIAIRLLQGIFAGAVGVARGCVISVTDTTNEGRAYAILGFCWGFGGVAGAIIGGTFESPAVKWPGIFSRFDLLVKYPYLFPCALAASITFTGSVLSLFLGRDGGPREGAIRLAPEKPGDSPNAHPPIPEEEPETPNAFENSPSERGLVGSLRKKVSGYFAQRVHDAHAQSSTSPVPMSSPVSRPRAFSRTSRADGSAYGYNGGRGSQRNRLTSGGARRASAATIGSSIRRRRASHMTEGGPSSLVDGSNSDLNFAQRLLMANENAVTNIADLWVAAAMNVDYEDEDPFLETDDEEDDTDTEMGSDSDGGSPSPRRSRPKVPRLSVTSNRAARPSLSSNFGARPSFSSGRRASASQQHAPGHRLVSDPDGARRLSIFAHPGVKTPPAVIDAQQLLTRSELTPDASNDLLAPIHEHHRASVVADDTEKPPSLTSQLPVLIIVQYGLLALHTTTHDQVFLSYLVSDYGDGGLNLNAGHFAQLIALMCLAQIAYQFYLYPNIGPPRGRFSHLSMFRVGSLLFIPAYLTVVPYRVFASAADDGNFFLMAALAVSTALRYCGSTFAYTSIAILLNYMTPPNAVGYANGVAQSIVSLARCFGPILGGYLWSASVEDGPSGYYLGFVVCAGVGTFAVASSFMIR
ncbi:hypothetical protein PLICRDRAFT_42144 [Plicaturopsis crispa FD-325 SS-3]|nr:hypothetical protein PLICRDRAFT_42144 [Plicaturopsis crispa FD-325 SS-3]